MRFPLKVIFMSLLLSFTVSLNAQAQSIFDDILDGDFSAVKGKLELKSWNSDNSGSYDLSDARLGCGGNYGATHFGYGVSSGGSDCELSGKFENNTNDIIRSVVLEVKYFHKTSGKTAAKDKVTVFVNSIPGASVDFKREFDNGNFKLAYEQLGDNAGWNYEIVGAVPDGAKANWLY